MAQIDFPPGIKTHGRFIVPWTRRPDRQCLFWDWKIKCFGGKRSLEFLECFLLQKKTDDQQKTYVFVFKPSNVRKKLMKLRDTKTSFVCLSPTMFWRLKTLTR